MLPIFTQLLRRTFHLAVAAFVLGVSTSCATKKEKAAPTASVAAADKKKAAATPTPSPTPAPAPTPQAHYTASVKVDGVDVTPNQPLDPDAQATPGPTPTATPTPSASPSPTPKAAPPNFLAGAWQKFFPPKPAPAPTPGETGGVTIRVSTSEGGETQQVVRKGTGPDPAANALPSPTPIQIKLRPTEGFLTRMWHKVFPKKQEPPAAEPPQWIGTIKLINERDGYALIDSPTSFAVPPGETLNSVGTDTESGVLRATTDSNPPFFIADIVSGKPRAGDRVYSPKP